jgi:hypothetical protein
VAPKNTAAQIVLRRLSQFFDGLHSFATLCLEPKRLAQFCDASP